MSANGQHPLLQRLADGKPLISDGAGGTYLQSKGLEPGGSPEEMNASAPETIREMATAYFDAGSDMVLTASFGGSRFMLEKYGLGGRGGRAQPAGRASCSERHPGRRLRRRLRGPDGRDPREQRR